MWTSNPSDIVQNRKLNVFSEEWDGNIWGNSDNKKPGKDDSLSLSNPPEYEARPTIKTKQSERPRGGAPCTSHPLGSATNGETTGKSSRKPNKVFGGVCLNNGDLILLCGDEANGFCGPGRLQHRTRPSR